MDKATVLSQNSLTGRSTCIPSSCKKFLIHITSQAAAHINLNSASAEDLDTVACFLLFQGTKDLPKKTQNPVTDFLVLTHFAQSESAYAVRLSPDP
ncbi:hypothetical protein HanRHA438_Chr09g0425581 [Helianthus annuus]|nr:hypothetical protein HanRHA438_Chr09g0425581 [Helianthus annuus]